MHINSLMRQL